MRYQHLFERTTENMQVLTDCTDALVKSLPYKFDKNQRFMIMGEQLPGMRALLTKYKDSSYLVAVQQFYQTLFVFDNSDQRVGTGTMGAFVAKPHNQLFLYVSAFMNSSDVVKVSDVMAHKIPLAIKTMRATIVHEVRHLFQSALYHKYFYSRGRDGEVYKTSKVEIDAAWTHMLEDHPIAEYDSVSKFVEAVMTELTGYKSLNPKEIMHFRRKTARYYYDRTGQAGEDALANPAKDRLISNRTKMASWLATTLGAGKDFDCRKLPGYNPETKNFIIPDRVMRGAGAVLGKGERIAPDKASMVFLAVSLMISREQGPAVRSFLKNAIGVTLEQAMEQADRTFQGFDVDALKRHIMAVFG